MNREEEKFENLFRETFREWAPTPPEDVWESIVAEQRRRKRFFIYRISAVAAALLLLLSLPFVLTRINNLDQKPQTLSQAADSVSIESNTDFSTNAIKLGTPASESPAKATPVQNIAEQKIKSHQNIASQDGLTNISEQQYAIVPIPSNEEKVNLEDVVEPQQENTITLADQNWKDPQKALEEMLEKLKQEEAVLVSTEAGSGLKFPEMVLSYNFAPANIIGENGLFNNIASYRFGPDPFQGRMSYETRNFKDIEESRLEAPFSAGLKLAFMLSKRVSFETGLIYTRLNTYTKTYPFDGVHLEYNQSLVYLGLPLGMRYDIYQSRLFGVYFAQNVMPEKGILAVNTINKIKNQRNIGRQKLYENVKGFQLSTTSSAGIGLNVHRYIAFYAESGLQIFYLNHTQPFNIRSSKQLWPIYQTGLRINF